MKNFCCKIQHVTKTATLAGLAVFFASFTACANRIAASEDVLENTDSIPTMVMLDVSAIQTDKGMVTGQLSAPRMERYTKGTHPYDIFPDAFRVVGYDSEGRLETEIVAKKAIHRTGNPEQWEAYGDVVINNYIKKEKMETDTLYWDRAKKEIYTHCFVRISSPDFFMQGYGMRSDERATNAIILRPFDTYLNFKKEDMIREETPEPRDSLVFSPVADTIKKGPEMLRH